MALGSSLRDVVDSFSELTAQHIRLARLELAADAKFIGWRIGLVAALAPLIFMGYGSLCVALAFALQRVVAPEVSFLIVGLVNVTAGVGGIFVAIKQLQTRPVMKETVSQLEATVSLVQREREP